MLLLSLALAHPAVVPLSGKGMEAPAIAYAFVVAPDKDRIQVVAPLSVLYAVKNGKEAKVATGTVDPAWLSFRGELYLGIADTQVRLTEDMVKEVEPVLGQVTLAFPSRLIRTLPSKVPHMALAGRVPLPGEELTLPEDRSFTVVRTWEEGYLRGSEPCPMAGEPVLDGFGRALAMTLASSEGGCLTSLLPDTRATYSAARADVEKVLELWKVPDADFVDLLPAILEGLPATLTEPALPAPSPTDHDSVLMRKVAAVTGRECSELDAEAAAEWNKLRTKATKKHKHPAFHG